MNRQAKWMVAGTAVGLVLAAGTGVVAASGGDSDTPITGSALVKASAAALDHTGGGRVTDTEIEDEESYYEVEVTLDDGSQVDVQLDRQFTVVGSDADEADDEGDDAGHDD